MSQSSSLNSNFVGILIPYVVCSISVSVLWRIVPYVSEGNRETDLWLCTHSSPTEGCAVT